MARPTSPKVKETVRADGTSKFRARLMVDGERVTIDLGDERDGAVGRAQAQGQESALVVGWQVAERRLKFLGGHRASSHPLTDGADSCLGLLVGWRVLGHRLRCLACPDARPAVVTAAQRLRLALRADRADLKHRRHLLIEGFAIMLADGHDCH